MLLREDMSREDEGKGEPAHELITPMQVTGWHTGRYVDYRSLTPILRSRSTYPPFPVRLIGHSYCTRPSQLGFIGFKSYLKDSLLLE